RLGKFEGKADEGFLVRYFVNITARNQTNNDAGIEINANPRKARQKKASDHEYILLPFMPSSTQSLDDKNAGEVLDKGDEGVSKESGVDDQEMTNSSTQDVDNAEPSINNASTNINTFSLNINSVGSNDLSMSSLEETSIFDDVYDDREVGAEADTNNLELSTVFSALLWRRGVLLLRLTNNGWVDGNGLNSGGGFGKPEDGRETRSDGDGLEGHRGQLSMVEVQNELVSETYLKMMMRNKPQTMSQQKKTMCIYMKNMAGYKMEHFNGKRFYEVNEIFDKVYKQVISFVPMELDIGKEGTKRARLNIQEEILKRQKTKEGSESTEEPKADEISQDD
nr:hypothetical protein [Tanacetum cinerariifolium]